MTALSVLDLSPVVEGGTASQSLAHSLDLARNAERLGYRRSGLAEHHNMPGIASAATAVVIAHIAGGTKTIRVGAGGIMLPNHAPLVIAEQFGTLAALFPGRIDLGLGRAPGADMLTARALRRNLEASDNFPQDVVELMDLTDVLRADVGQIVETLKESGRQHALVVDADINGRQMVRGVFSASQIARQLGIPLHTTEVARTFAEIEAAVVRAGG